jgi:hypothetical protein
MKIAFDIELMRPGCVLLQASYGCLCHELELYFPTETWLTAPTAGLAVYDVTEPQLQKLSEFVKHRHKLAHQQSEQRAEPLIPKL